MGLYASAQLIYGVPVSDRVEWDEPSQYWDSENDDWREYDLVEVIPYGRYDNPDELLGILTIKGVEHFEGDCWDAREIQSWEFDFSQGLIEAAVKRHPELNEAKWCLAASFG